MGKTDVSIIIEFGLSMLLMLKRSQLNVAADREETLPPGCLLRSSLRSPLYLIQVRLERNSYGLKGNQAKLWPCGAS